MKDRKPHQGSYFWTRRYFAFICKGRTCFHCLLPGIEQINLRPVLNLSEKLCVASFQSGLAMEGACRCSQVGIAGVRKAFKVVDWSGHLQGVSFAWGCTLYFSYLSLCFPSTAAACWCWDSAWWMSSCIIFVSLHIWMSFWLCPYALNELHTLTQSQVYLLKLQKVSVFWCFSYFGYPWIFKWWRYPMKWVENRPACLNDKANPSCHPCAGDTQQAKPIKLEMSL